MAPSLGWMHGSDSQWFPVTCHGTRGGGTIFTGEEFKLTVPEKDGNLRRGRQRVRRLAFLLSPQDVIASVRSPGSRWRIPLCASALVVALVPFSAGAQLPTGPLEDATVAPRGTFRFTGIYSVLYADERFGLNTPGRRAGSLEPLGTDYMIDLGVNRFPQLSTVENDISLISDIPSFMLSLGRPIVQSEMTQVTVPMSIDVGVTSRLMVGVTVPYVKTRGIVVFDMDMASGTVGLNPAISPGIARSTNVAFRDQITQTSNALQSQLDFCAANPGAGSCPALEANRADAEALIIESRELRDRVEAVYGSDTSDAISPVVPRHGSVAQAAIDARATEMSTLYRSLLGLGAEPIVARPFGASAPLTAAEANALFGGDDPLFGTGAQIRSSTRSHVGDIEVGAKLLLLDTFGASVDGTTRFGTRLAVGGAVRFPTGQEDDPNDLFDIPTGDGQLDVEARSALDLLIARRFTAGIRARYTVQLGDDVMARITDDPSDVLPAAYREQSVQRDLGDILELEATPRYALGDYFSVVANYLYRRRGQDSYVGQFTVPDEITGIGDVELDASTLNAETSATEHRVGAGFAFSTRAAIGRGLTRWPIEVSYLHAQSVRGSGGRQPKFSQDVFQIRVFTGRP